MLQFLMKPIQFFRSLVVKFVELSGFPPFSKVLISNLVGAAKYFRKNTKKMNSTLFN